MTRPFFKPDERSRVDDELGFHLEMHVRDLIARGVEPALARQQAEQELGDRQSVADECRRLDQDIDQSERRTRLFREVSQDARFAVRMMRRRRAFAAIAIVTLALGIGAATSIYSVVDSVLLKPLPFPEPDRIGALWITQPELALNPAIAWLAEATPVGNAEYQLFRERARGA